MPEEPRASGSPRESPWPGRRPPTYLRLSRQERYPEGLAGNRMCCYKMQFMIEARPGQSGSGFGSYNSRHMPASGFLFARGLQLLTLAISARRSFVENRLADRVGKELGKI